MLLLFTFVPGLSAALQVGRNYSRDVALEYSLPLIPIHHMEAHALAVRMQQQVRLGVVKWSVILILVFFIPHISAVSKIKEEMYQNLESVLGSEVFQTGTLNAPRSLKISFSHYHWNYFFLFWFVFVWLCLSHPTPKIETGARMRHVISSMNSVSATQPTLDCNPRW